MLRAFCPFWPRPAVFPRVLACPRPLRLGLRVAPSGSKVLSRPEPGRFFGEWIQTGDGRVDCCPRLFEGALERAASIFDELLAEPSDQLKLISRRDHTMHNSWYQNLPKLKRGAFATNRLYINSADAEARGFTEGEQLRVESGSGVVLFELGIDDTLREGVVAATHGWGNADTPGMSVAQANPGVNANALLPTGSGSFEPLSNQAFMTGIPVAVTTAS